MKRNSRKGRSHMVMRCSFLVTAPAMAERTRGACCPVPTALLVHEGSLRRVGDALPDGDGLGVAGVHGLHFFTVPPVPATTRNNMQGRGEGGVRSGQPPLAASPRPPGPCSDFRADLNPGKTARPKHKFCCLPCVCENWVCYCVFSQHATVNKNYISIQKGSINLCIFKKSSLGSRTLFWEMISSRILVHLFLQQS